MRLITRADLDGIVCGVLITSKESINSFLFVEPKCMQDGEVQVSSEDIIANLPNHPACHLWFDHHITNHVPYQFRGNFRIAPSAARVVFEYYSEESLNKYEALVKETDRIDSGNLTVSDVLHPERHVLLSFTIDGTNKADEAYWIHLMHLLREDPFPDVMASKEIKQRCEQVLSDFERYQEYLKKYSRQEGNLVITDFRGSTFRGKENRFLIYTLFPTANISVKIFDDAERPSRIGISLGKSIFNRTSSVNVGELLAHHGGGGHDGAGSCRVPNEEAEQVIAKIIEALQKKQ